MINLIESRKKVQFLCKVTGRNSIFAKKRSDMTITSEVRNRVDALQADMIFSYQDLELPSCYSEAVIKALNRMVQDGKIEKYAKGKFYKPVISVFGKLKPGRDEVVKDLLFRNGERIGYITGYAIFNQLALTTQVPNVIQIGARERKIKMKRGLYAISFVFQRNEITEENIPQLQFLDVIRMIKVIPDTTVEKSLKRLMEIIKTQREEEMGRIITLAQNYPPATRALTGAMIEHVWGEKRARPLFETLNPITSYSYGIAVSVLPEIKKWRIV